MTSTFILNNNKGSCKYHGKYREMYNKGKYNFKCIPFFYNIPDDIIIIIGSFLNAHECNIFALLTGVDMENLNPCEKCNCVNINILKLSKNFPNIEKNITTLGLKINSTITNNKSICIQDFNWKNFKNKKIYIKLTHGIPSDIGWRISRFLSKNISHHDIQESYSFIKTLEKYSNYKSNSKLDLDRPLFFRNYEKEDCEYFEKLFSESINPIIVSSYIIDYKWLDKFDYIILPKAIQENELDKLYTKYFKDIEQNLFIKIYKKLKNIFILDIKDIQIYNI